MKVNFLTKVVKISSDYWGCFVNISLKEKTTVASFGNFFLKKIGLLFIPTSGHTGGKALVGRIVVWGNVVVASFRVVVKLSFELKTFPS